MSTLATCWILTRRDGLRLGFTEHDSELEVDGVTCRPRSGFVPTTVETQMGFAHDSAGLAGVLDDVSLSVADLRDGLYDGARIATWRVDWTGVADARLLRTQRILSLTSDGSRRFDAEVVGLGAELETVSGRVVSKLCGAQFGDAACGIDAALYPAGTNCARSFSACKGFSNTQNYQGFPHLIGEDALVQGATDTAPRDGSSRYGNGPNV